MPENNNNNNMKRKGPEAQSRLIRVVVVVLTLILAAVLYSMTTNGLFRTPADELPTSAFVAAVKDGRISEVTFGAANHVLRGQYWRTVEDAKDAKGQGKGAEEARSRLHPFTSTYIGSDSLEELMAEHPDITFKVDTSTSSLLDTLIMSIIPTGIMVLAFIYIMNRIQGISGGAMNFGRAAHARTNDEERPNTKFSDVAGIDEAVEELQEVRDFLSNPERYQRMGAKIPRGVLLVGPPGTGKTLLAKAVAGEAGVPFYSISGSDFVEMFVGVGASRVRDLFKQAKNEAPAIVFIDEIDAVGRQRGAGLGGGHDEREQTLNQLLVEMDGFTDKETIILIAATNRPDILDPALLRPGRFDRRVTVDAPDVKGREQILRVHAANKPLADDVDFSRIASLTPGFSGADLANLMNESALLAARRRKDKVTFAEVEEAMERVMAGPERRSRVITEKERRTIAYHESGHALVGHVLTNSDPVHKISIVARGRALGYTMQVPEEDHFLETRNGMLDDIAVLLGGRTAEELYCDDITTGASNDLERATALARDMVTRYGMSDELGTQVYGEGSHDVFLGRDYVNHRDLAAETARRIDSEVERIMREAHARARQVLESREEQMNTMANVLLERETVEGEAVEALLNNKWEAYAAEHPWTKPALKNTDADNEDVPTQVSAASEATADKTDQEQAPQSETETGEDATATMQNDAAASRSANQPPTPWE